MAKPFVKSAGKLLGLLNARKGLRSSFEFTASSKEKAYDRIRNLDTTELFPSY